jgi:FAD/FMN-containing dehydrogenase/Fe-S oxidoreductase
MKKLQNLAQNLDGELHYDMKLRILYATDASAYRQIPMAVAIPKTEKDLKTLILFAKEEGISLIPRTAGTSLAGQVVGEGIVVDVSVHFNQILEVNPEEKTVWVQAGVIRDELNRHLKKHNLFFAPETSTANRAMVGGMVGNNSCGSNSVAYGSTREHLLEVKALLSDASEVSFKSLTSKDLEQKKQQKNLEGKLYRDIFKILSDKENQEEIIKEFPKPSIPRRNTGYALDLLLQTAPFNSKPENSETIISEFENFNFSKLIAGSEGTLAFMTAIKLNLLPLPPKEKALICVHFESVDAALRGNLIALKYKPQASELMDKYILDCTKENKEQAQNRFFVKGDPAAILVIDLARENPQELENAIQNMIEELKNANLGEHFPIVKGADMKRVWTLRKAGLGLLANIKGDAKAVAVIEDTAVDVEDLPNYIRDFNLILKKYDLYCVHYAHAGSGELHLRPILNLKTEEGNKMFRIIAQEIAELVKKYRGSLSGEHGDGRLRGEFIPFMIGEKNYQLIQEVKRIFDPNNIFNPQKIVETPSMNSSLRYAPNQKTPDFETIFSFEKQGGILRAAELCNGSGDCRKTELAGGTMCPSYMATRREQDTTRARANILREMLTQSKKKNPFDHSEIKEVMDLCLSCKACKSECPSNVDVAKLKAEFLQQYYKSNGVPFRTRQIANFTKSQKIASLAPTISNSLINSSLAKRIMGFSTKRPMPKLQKTTLRKWWKKEGNKLSTRSENSRKVYLFCDEFTNFNDTHIGIAAVKLLTKLGYEVLMCEHRESGRTYLSKGLVSEAKVIANENIAIFKDLISEKTPLLGIEPSTILTFRDEYLDLAEVQYQESSQEIAKNTFLIDEFIAQEIEKGNISKAQFTDEKKEILLHGHCHQKALSSVSFTEKMLDFPKNYTLKTIPSGCCGMAGSFGYEKEHYEVSMKIGELVLFPAVRQAENETLIAALGTSCRHQIKDGTGRKSLHPIEILFRALV